MAGNHPTQVRSTFPESHTTCDHCNKPIIMTLHSVKPDRTSPTTCLCPECYSQSPFSTLPAPNNGSLFQRNPFDGRWYKVRG